MLCAVCYLSTHASSSTCWLGISCWYMIARAVLTQPLLVQVSEQALAAVVALLPEALMPNLATPLHISSDDTKQVGGGGGAVHVAQLLAATPQGQPNRAHMKLPVQSSSPA